jgi:uncharacterized membrane protein YkvA (DUF1232 family)
LTFTTSLVRNTEPQGVSTVTSSKSASFASEESLRENFWRTAKKAARHVPFMEDVVAAYYCALDKETPLRAKGILLAALGYFILPADAIPDMIVGLGFTDDVAVLTAALAAIRVNLKPAHRLAAKEALAEL